MSATATSDPGPGVGLDEPEGLGLRVALCDGDGVGLGWWLGVALGCGVVEAECVADALVADALVADALVADADTALDTDADAVTDAGAGVGDAESRLRSTDGEGPADDAAADDEAAPTVGSGLHPTRQAPHRPPSRARKARRSGVDGGSVCTR